MIHDTDSSTHQAMSPFVPEAGGYPIACAGSMEVSRTGGRESVTGDVVIRDDFIAPVSSDFFDGLLGEYEAKRERVEEVAELVQGDAGGVIVYFLDGNKEHVHSPVPSTQTLFALPGAMASLNAAYWSRALKATDVYSYLPQARRDEWDKVIKTNKVPDFTEDNVRTTIGDLLDKRALFLGERVDGIFRTLSRAHVTNSPQGFNSRMIIGGLFDWSDSLCWSKAGAINDLRCVIAKFLGWEEPHAYDSNRALELCRANSGQWHSLDGGALRVRVYLKGTAHLEVHPEIAWRLNAILHTLYPLALATDQRTKPTKTIKTFQMIRRPLPVDVLAILNEGTITERTFQFKKSLPIVNKVQAEAQRVLEQIGGVCLDNDCMVFDYEPYDAIHEIVLSGGIPDRVSHQFYPTPKSVATTAVEMAGIDVGHRCLEPSAGTGGLADFLPQDRTRCVEISALHCKVLAAKGYDVVQADFLAWAKDTSERFDRCVMNPPFSEGRARAHLEAAYKLLAPGGRVVAVLPASMRDKALVDDAASCSWSPVFSKAFPGTSMAVSIVALDKPA